MATRTTNEPTPAPPSERAGTLTRRGFVGALAAGALVLIAPERPPCPRLSDRPGGRWIGHL